MANVVMIILENLFLFSVLNITLAVTAATSVTEDAVTNIALHKETLQSHLSGYDSGIVVDGRTDQYVTNGFCINIEKKGESWWRVDLGDIYTLFHVRAFLAKDCCDSVSVEELNCYVPFEFYYGHENTTAEGKSCLPWDQISGDGVHFFFDDGIHVERTHARIQDYRNNYCRVIGEITGSFFDRLSRGRPGCFVFTSSDHRYATWKYCDIEECELEVITDDLNLKIGTQDTDLEIKNYDLKKDRVLKIRDFILSSDSRARYVELQQDGTMDYYPLCEVEVYGVKDEVTNIALGKKVEMSFGIVDRWSVEGFPSEGIGNLQSVIKEGSCFNADVGYNPFLLVDLEDIYMISMVRLHDHHFTDGDFAHDIRVYAGPSVDTMSDTNCAVDQIDDIKNYILPVNTEARFVKLLLIDYDAFRLCKIEIFGSKAKCKHDPCENGGVCSVVYCDDQDSCRNYSCACANGYGGINCEIRIYNAAIGAKVEASSIYYKNWQPSNIVDGDINQNVMFGATCLSTKSEVKPYLIVDLGETYTLTGVIVYRRLDCCGTDSYSFELFLMMSTWTSFGDFGSLRKNITKFSVYPYVDTVQVKLVAKEENPVSLQLCEIEVLCKENKEIAHTTSVEQPKLMTDKPMPFMQMRFSLPDKYSDVVKSVGTFSDVVRQGLAIGTGYPVESFRNIEVEKDPFRVSFELHAVDSKKATLNEMLEKIDMLNRFGILEIETENGQPVPITAGSLQYHLLYLGNEGTRPDSNLLAVVSFVLASTWI